MSVLNTAFKSVSNELSKMACIFIQFCKGLNEGGVLECSRL